MQDVNKLLCIFSLQGTYYLLTNASYKEYNTKCFLFLNYR